MTLDLRKNCISMFLLLLVLTHFGIACGIPSNIVINEIMYHPGHEQGEIEQPAEEFIELYNNSGIVANLGSWQFTEGIDYTIPDGTILPARGYLVIAADIDIFTSLHPDVTNPIGTWQGRLSNSGENITLVDETGMLVDTVQYADQGDWSERQLGPLDHEHRGWMWADDHDGLGASLELINAALSNKVGQNWAASKTPGGTPGSVNSVARSDIAPMILDMIHWPLIPGPNTPVTVSAQILDELENGLAVTLHHRLDGNNPFTTEPMFDDGMHGDIGMGDGIYGGDIPAQESGSIVEFYVQAMDVTGNSRAWPKAVRVDGYVQHTANALYQVDDSVDLEATWIPGSQPIYHVTMIGTERAELKDIGDGGDPFFGEARSNAQMNATFVCRDGLGTQVRYSAGIRNRGNRSRAQPPNNYRINFTHDRPWKKVTALVLNSKYPHIQLMGSALFRLAGIPAPEATAVQLRINGNNPAEGDYGRMYDTYVALEVYDSDWAKNHVPDDDEGNIYRGTYAKLSGGGTTYGDLDYKESPGTPPVPDNYRDNYPKQTNGAQDDYTDLFDLIDALNNPTISDANLLEEVGQVADLNQWTRYMATDAFAGNREGGLYEGEGDDYAMYRGIEDPRFWLLPHDLDTLLGQGDHSYNPDWEIFSYPKLNGLKRLFGENEIWQGYYSHFQTLAASVFASEHFDPLVDQLLADWVPSSEIEGTRGIKQFLVDRRDSLLYSQDSQIPQQFAIECDLSIVQEYYWTNSRTLNASVLTGKANAIITSSVLVDGQFADWTQRTGRWATGQSILLAPGINRVWVQTFDGPMGTGKEIDTGFIDIWYDDGDVAQISGLLTGDHRLGAASGPWHVIGDVTVDTDAALTIEPGTTLYFAPGVKLTVLGQLQALGLAHESIRMTCAPGTETPWSGILLDRSDEDNRLDHVDIEYADSDPVCITVDHARLSIEHVTWSNTNNVILDVTHPQLTIEQSVFPSQNNSRTLEGNGLTDSEYLILKHNTFGPSSSDQTVLKYGDCQRPGPILELYDNTFLGGHGDGITLENADAHIEGNHFTQFQGHSGPGIGHAITALGDSRLTVTRNVFFSNDDGIFLTDNCQLDATYNTFVGQVGVAIGFDNSGAGPGVGARVDGTIFRDNTAVFGGILDSVTLSVNQSVIPIEWHNLGLGNLDIDPLFVHPNGNFSLKSHSGAAGTGPCTLDRGAHAQPGAAICSVPEPVTFQTTALLTVGGPGIVAYRYAVNAPYGPWSEEIPVHTPVELTQLVNGQSYQLYALGKNSAGVWQPEESATVSGTWTVDTSHAACVINEIQAYTLGTEPGIIELYYNGPSTLDLTGFALTDDPAEPGKFVFNSSTVSTTTMNPGDYLLLFGDPTANTANHLGFALSAKGENLYLYGKPGTDGVCHLVDHVTFGPQINGASIGRIGINGTWKLTVPTPGTANLTQPLGDPDQLKINEWLASSRSLFEDDFIELYNPQALPVAMGGMTLTDNPITQPDKHRIPPLSFVPAEGYVTFWANDGIGPTELGFKLSGNGEMIGLFNEQLHSVDQILYTSQTSDVFQGRMPNGSVLYDFFELPTPGLANISSGLSVITSTLVPENTDKMAIIPTSADHIASSWKSDPDFDTSNWTPCTGGPGGIGYDRGSGGDYDPLITLEVEAAMYQKTTSCLVRIPFVVTPSELDQATGLILKMRYDDGVVAYINGVEMTAARRNFSGTAQWNSHASGSHEADNENWDSAVDVSEYLGTLSPGKNILALHALNQSTTSSDFVISAELDVTKTVLGEEYPYLNDLDVLAGLRISELMYHASEGGEYDYIELTNIINTPIDLGGVRFSDGVEFEFPAWQLDPGQVVVIVSDLVAFQSRYGDTATVAGQYRGGLSNGGEKLVLTLAWPLEAAVMSFEFSDRWYPKTDGNGPSLKVVDVTEETEMWNHAENWQVASPSPGIH